MTELSTATKLAIERTLMAADRTLMAWIRTALSMISFGFTIYKVIQGIQDKDLHFDFDGYAAGLVLNALGVFSVVVGMIDYSGTVRSIKQNYDVSHRRPSMAIALVILAIGSMIFMAILTRIL